MSGTRAGSRVLVLEFFLPLLVGQSARPEVGGEKPLKAINRSLDSMESENSYHVRRLKTFAIRPPGGSSYSTFQRMRSTFRFVQ